MCIIELRKTTLRGLPPVRDPDYLVCTSSAQQINLALSVNLEFKDMASLSSMLQFKETTALYSVVEPISLSIFRVVSLVVPVRFKETTALYSVVEPISLSIFRVVSLVNSVEFKETVALSSMNDFLRNQDLAASGHEGD
ncbi:hypothetical protein Tco_0355456 [Tanacetum coccineum]